MSPMSHRPQMLRRFVACLLLLGAPLAFSSCAALYFLGGGKGSKDALYTIPKGKRVLVFVDAPPSITLPAGYAKALGEKISNHLYKYKAADAIVAQERLATLKNDPTFAKMGIADIARETEADLVIYVNVVAFNLATSTDQSVVQGDAEILVKVIDSDGKRVYPVADPAGTAIPAHLDPSLLEGHSDTAVLSELADLLAVRAGRMFHSYHLDDPEMTK